MWLSLVNISCFTSRPCQSLSVDRLASPGFLFHVSSFSGSLSVDRLIFVDRFTMISELGFFVGLSEEIL